MRILNLDGTYFVNALRSMGHDVLSIGRGVDKDVSLSEQLSLKDLMALLKSRDFEPELVLWCDRCEPPTVAGVETLPVPTIGFSIDQYCNPWHVPFSSAFDAFLVAQKDYVPLFGECEPAGNEILWFPLFCDEELDVDPKGERDVPVSFVGTVEGSINTTRKAFLNAFKRHHPVFIMQGEYRPVFGRSRIVINQSAAEELNFRIFQALACGAAILTEEAHNGFDELFTHGENVLTYPRGDAAAAARVAREWLSKPQELARLVATGRDYVLREHSRYARAEQLMDIASRLFERQSWKRRIAGRAALNNELAKVYIMLGGDMELPMPDKYREYFLALAHVYLDKQ